MRTVVWTGGVLPLVLAAGLLAGCGGGGGSAATATITTSVVPSSPAASTDASAASADAVARVANVPISKASYEHWLAVETKLGGSANAGHRALAFLITSQWVLGEAAARKLSVSEAEVKQRFAQISKQSFPKAGALQKFLAKAGETEADLLARVKVELLESRISAQVTSGKTGAQASAVLASFQNGFKEHWKRYTTCEPGYVMEDCSEYHGGPENLTATASSGSGSSSARSASGSRVSSSSSSSGSTGHGASRSSASGSSSSSGELPPPQSGAMAISSSAFERNGAIPAQYTCDGANISPPLEWQNVPKKAAALVLIAIDDSSTGPASGIRWFVGDINPSSKGVAAGQTPEGGIAGSDTQGRSGYGGICPPPGKTATIQFTLYALSKKIPLTPGFQPALAEEEYGQGKLLMGEAAVTYGTYTRG
jgi:Raf kinase inhibitor-like YbhB/YbcL family protein